MSSPAKKILPLVGASNPASMRNKVDFPHPEPPSNAKISPVATVSETLSTAFTIPSKILVTPSIRSKSSRTILAFGAIAINTPIPQCDLRLIQIQ